MLPISVRRAMARHSYLQRMEKDKELEKALLQERQIDGTPVFDRGHEFFLIPAVIAKEQDL